MKAGLEEEGFIRATPRLEPREGERLDVGVATACVDARFTCRDDDVEVVEAGERVWREKGESPAPVGKRRRTGVSSGDVIGSLSRSIVSVENYHNA